MPCPTYRMEAAYSKTMQPNGDKFPFGPASQLVLQVLCNDAYVPSSKILPIVTCLGPSPLLASRLSPFHPCTPTFDGHSPAVG